MLASYVLAGGEWAGAWSDWSEEWTEELQGALGYSFGDDGTFWMELSDFISHFNTLYVARLFGRRGWRGEVVRGGWGEGSGGSPRCSRWRHNPCVLVELPKKAGMFVTLSQPDT